MLVLAVSPLGQEVIRNMRSNEGLSRNMAEIVLVIYGPILLVLALLEWLIRWRINAQRKIPPAAQTPVVAERKSDQSEA